jgi:LEA14-like dessication related protein
MMASMKNLLLGGVLAVVLAGCSVLAPKLETPRLSIVNVEVLKTDIFEQRLKVRLRVQNPNDRELPVKGITYCMEVAGEDFAQGASAAAFNVPALGEAEFDMNVTANMATTLIRVLTQSGGDRDSLDYRMVGKVSLAKGFLRQIPFEEKGTIKLR